MFSLYGDVCTLLLSLIALMCLDYDQFIHSWSEKDGRTTLSRFQEMFKQNMAEVISEVRYPVQTEPWPHTDTDTRAWAHICIH